MKDFTTPSANSLETLDCSLQNSKVSRRWEYSGVPDIFYQNTKDGNEDWADIFKNNHQQFMLAWYKTLAFINEYNLNIEEITQEWV